MGFCTMVHSVRVKDDRVYAMAAKSFFLLIIKMRTKFNISTHNRDDSGEHALYNRYRSLRYLQIYYKRQKEREELR